MTPTASNSTSHDWAKRLSLLGFGALVLAILILGLKPAQKQSQLAETIQTGGHFIFFAALAAAAAIVLPYLQPKWRSQAAQALLAGLLAAVLIGGALEALQGLTATRHPSWRDWLHDIFGALAGVATLAVVDRPGVDRGMPRWLLMVSFPILIGAIGLGLWPLADCARDYYRRDQMFPSLHVFAASWSERFLWHDECVQVAPCSPPAGWPTRAGRDIGEIWMEPAKDYPGVGFKEPTPNWVGYDSLQFDCYNPTAEVIPMAIRVHDFAHNDDMYDRFNRVLEVAPGFQTFRFPLTDIIAGPRKRRLDLTSIEGVKLFAIKPTRPLHLYLGNFRLERR